MQVEREMKMKLEPFRSRRLLMHLNHLIPDNKA